MFKEPLTVSVNGEFCEILALSGVEEQFPDTPITSFLIQISTDEVKFSDKNKLELSIIDKNGDYGEVLIFLKL
ncbi:hypothetical protein [Treponema pedis]|uniref:hypothetical protein n=1 Tax=Treponema pedis TaxID=409322 RepID=UPI0003FB9C76|nr:hypothetical protein [Treponema pedis]